MKLQTFGLQNSDGTISDGIVWLAESIIADSMLYNSWKALDCRPWRCICRSCKSHLELSGVLDSPKHVKQIQARNDKQRSKNGIREKINDDFERLLFSLISLRRSKSCSSNNLMCIGSLPKRKSRTVVSVTVVEFHSVAIEIQEIFSSKWTISKY